METKAGLGGSATLTVVQPITLSQRDDVKNEIRDAIEEALQDRFDVPTDNREEKRALSAVLFMLGTLEK